jgi:hypothetical protein
MTILKGKHNTKEVDGVRCSIVEEGVSASRRDFLKKILELNKYTVHVEEKPAAEEGGEVTYTIGVTSMIFNPVIAVYQRMLFTEDGRRITPDYWNQKTDEIVPNYWDRSLKSD